MNEEDKLDTELYAVSEGALDKLNTEVYTLRDEGTLLKLSIKLCTLDNEGVGVKKGVTIVLVDVDCNSTEEVMSTEVPGKSLEVDVSIDAVCVERDAIAVLSCSGACAVLVIAAIELTNGCHGGISFTAGDGSARTRHFSYAVIKGNRINLLSLCIMKSV